MDHRCDCERGGNCTRTTMCHVQSVVDDLNGEHEIDIERLQARVDALEGAIKTAKGFIGHADGTMDAWIILSKALEGEGK